MLSRLWSLALDLMEQMCHNPFLSTNYRHAPIDILFLNNHYVNNNFQFSHPILREGLGYIFEIHSYLLCPRRYTRVVPKFEPSMDNSTDADSTQPPSQMSTTDLCFPMDENTQLSSKYAETIRETFERYG